MSEEEITEICQEYKITNYKINDDMSINVYGDVKLLDLALVNIPLKFSKVTGAFDFGNNQLSTLEDCPSYVGGSFYCYNNELITIEHCPKHVGGDFFCSNNKLTTLQHLPVNFHVGGDFYCHKNKIKEAKEYSNLFFGYVGGDIYTQFSILNEFLNDNKNPPKKDLPKLLSELRKITL